MSGRGGEVELVGWCWCGGGGGVMMVAVVGSGGEGQIYVNTTYYILIYNFPVRPLDFTDEL